MNTSEPAPRYFTREAFTSIIEKFKWPYQEWMQDWPLEVSDEINLAYCVQEYPQLINEDEKFLLMTGILYTLDEAKEDDFELFSPKITEFLKLDFDIHKSTIYYWTCYRTDSEDEFTITPLMRDIWNFQF